MKAFWTEIQSCCSIFVWMKQTENSEKAENGCGKTSRRYCRYCGAKCDGSCPGGTHRIKLQWLWFPRCLTKASSWSFNPKRNGSWPWGSKGNKLKGLYLLFLYCLTIASRRSCSPKCDGSWPWGSPRMTLQRLHLSFLNCLALAIASRKTWIPKSHGSRPWGSQGIKLQRLYLLFLDSVPKQ